MISKQLYKYRFILIPIAVEERLQDPDYDIGFWPNESARSVYSEPDEAWAYAGLSSGLMLAAKQGVRTSCRNIIFIEPYRNMCLCMNY